MNTVTVFKNYKSQGYACKLKGNNATICAGSLYYIVHYDGVHFYMSHMGKLVNNLPNISGLYFAIWFPAPRVKLNDTS